MPFHSIIQRLSIGTSLPSFFVLLLHRSSFFIALYFLSFSFFINIFALIYFLFFLQSLFKIIPSRKKILLSLVFLVLARRFKFPNCKNFRQLGRVGVNSGLFFFFRLWSLVFSLWSLVFGLCSLLFALSSSFSSFFRPSSSSFFLLSRWGSLFSLIFFPTTRYMEELPNFVKAVPGSTVLPLYISLFSLFLFVVSCFSFR